ncbi:MAG: hypothetical protein KA354_24710 [Phycisphaerae bacterium]|nr:hypothetical protein [Phycisphaerae bacterium]
MAKQRRSRLGITLLVAAYEESMNNAVALAEYLGQARQRLSRKRSGRR